MIEVEIKLPVTDKEAILWGLRQQGFIPGEFVIESDIYFNSEERDLKKRDEALRIRSRKSLTSGKETSLITYKGPKTDTVSMTRRELETEIGDAGICEEIFIALGYGQRFEVIKERQYYSCDTITACVDAVKGLGDFLELEVLVPSENHREEALAEIEQVLTRLGHEMKETTRRSYLCMLQGAD